MAIRPRPRFQTRGSQRSHQIHWGWISLASVPAGVLIGALIADPRVAAVWVIGLLVPAMLTLLLGLGLLQKAWRGLGGGLVTCFRRIWETRQCEEAKELLTEAADSLDEVVDAHAPSRGHKMLPFSSQRYRRQAVLTEYEPLRAEVELAVSKAMLAGARDGGTMLLAKEPRGLRDLTALLAELRRMTIELS